MSDELPPEPAAEKIVMPQAPRNLVLEYMPKAAENGEDVTQPGSKPAESAKKKTLSYTVPVANPIKFK